MADIFFIILLYAADIVSKAVNLIFFTGIRGKKNYTYNMKLSESENVDGRGYVANQHRLSKFRYGLCQFDFNGCGAAAVYNILYYHKKASSFVKTVFELEKTVFFAGLLGSSPIGMKKFLEKSGFTVKFIFTKKKILEASLDGSCIIHFFFRKDFSAHYVAGLPHNDTGHFYFNGSVPCNTPLSTAEYLSVTEVKNRENKHPVAFHCMLTVKRKNKQ